MDKIIGYRVICTTQCNLFIGHNPTTGNNFITDEPPSPISRSDAYRRLAAFLDEEASASEDEEFVVQPVFEVLTPIQRRARELGGMLHNIVGDSLGLSREQMEKGMARELEMFQLIAKDLV